MSLNDDKWHHIALFRSGSILYLFIDGEQNNFYGVIDNATNNTTNNSPLYIGQRGGGVNNFKRKIENVRLWETALSNDEIKNDMHGEIPNLANLQATYNFNESVPNGNNSAITQVTDLNTSYHGTLHNFAKTGSSSNFTNGVSTVYVNKNANGAENGSSWTDAYTDLQDALSKAKYITAWVAAGTYKPTSGTDRNISFQIPDNVKVYGGFIGNEANYYELYIF